MAIVLFRDKNKRKILNFRPKWKWEKQQKLNK